MPVWSNVFEILYIDNTLVDITSEIELVNRLLKIKQLDDSYLLEGILQLDFWVSSRPSIKFTWKGAEKVYINLRINDEGQVQVQG